MQLDGVPTYTNVSDVEELAQYGTLKVYSAPTITEDQPLKHVKNEPLHIQVFTHTAG